MHRPIQQSACNGRRLWRALLVVLLFTMATRAQTPTPALLVLEKADNMLAIVDSASLKIVARVPAGPDPHEIVASPDGKLAYISNYGGLDSSLNTITVVDLVARRPLTPINLGALRHRTASIWSAASCISRSKPTKRQGGTISRRNPLIG